MAPCRWLCISTRANDEITRKKRIWGVARRYKNTIAKVKKGDTLLMYTRQELVDREVIPSSIAGIYESVSDVYEDSSPLFVTPKTLGEETFPLRIKVKPIKIFTNPILFKPLVPEMSIIKNKVMWTGSIRTAMKEIPEKDYLLIVNKGNN